MILASLQVRLAEPPIFAFITEAMYVMVTGVIN
jgi:hypothetical protein